VNLEGTQAFRPQQTRIDPVSVVSSSCSVCGGDLSKGGEDRQPVMEAGDTMLTW
jgi:hypothetical protein